MAAQLDSTYLPPPGAGDAGGGFGLGTPAYRPGKASCTFTVPHKFLFIEISTIII